MRKAKFTNRIKEAIVDRDMVCILCFKQWTDCHHVKFWTESNYNLDRNNLDQWVLLCRDCHWSVHSCSKWEWDRQKCIEYLIMDKEWNR